MIEIYINSACGEFLPDMEAVDRELIRRLAAPPRVVCLPTAAGQEGVQRICYWTNLAYDHFSRLEAAVEALPVIDQASANDPSLAGVIDGANFVYLSGGKPDYLYQTRLFSPWG
jgi:cyanophycinase